jgi:hypothetical protein
MKTVDDYMKEALEMANKGRGGVMITEKAEKIVVPEPEPLPPKAEPAKPVKPENSAKPKEEEKFDFEDIVIENNLDENENEDEDCGGEFEGNEPEDVEEAAEETDIIKPSFEDYISRRNRSWERATNPNRAKQGTRE